MPKTHELIHLTINKYYIHRVELMKTHRALRSHFTFATDGNLIGISEAAGLTTMAYDKENRLVSHITHDTATPTTYTYDGTGLKRAEITNSSRTTLIWDGSD